MSKAVACDVWWATPLPAGAASTWLAMLAPAERTRYEAYRRPADRLRFLTGRVLARTVAGRYLGVPPTSVELDATCPDCGKQHGKPRIPGNDLELSISHAGQRVGLAVAVGTSIGLDVESTSRSSGDDLLNYALSDAELDAVAGRPAAERARLFFTYWARKEALMKATGLGLKVPLRSITLAPPEAPPALLASAHDALDPATTAIVDLDAGQGYAAAVAALTANGLTVNQRWWRAADFGELKPSR